MVHTLKNKIPPPTAGAVGGENIFALYIFLIEVTESELRKEYEEIQKKYYKIRKKRNNAAKAYYRRNAKDILARIKRMRLDEQQNLGK